MTQYRAAGYRESTNREVLATPGRLEQAKEDASQMLREKKYKVILILRDSQGEDHPDNAGKFFLYKIIK